MRAVLLEYNRFLLDGFVTDTLPCGYQDGRTVNGLFRVRKLIPRFLRRHTDSSPGARGDEFGGKGPRDCTLRLVYTHGPDIPRWESPEIIPLYIRGMRIHRC